VRAVSVRISEVVATATFSFAFAFASAFAFTLVLMSYCQGIVAQILFILVP
jgi:hypothetical protein